MEELMISSAESSLMTSEAKRTSEKIAWVEDEA
jgi:hypothetical protein